MTRTTRMLGGPLRLGMGLLGMGLLVVGCAAQAENLDDRDWTVDHGVEADDEKLRDVETLFNEPEQDVDHFTATPRGVRHDLALAESVSADTRCTCLDVAIGKPSDRRFAWAADRPSISGKDLVIAVRTEGSECSGDAKGRRPSISAVEYRGDDVIVEVEELRGERPQALGAVVKRPGADGHLYVRSRTLGRGSPRLPYARSGDPRRDMCRVATDRTKHHLRALNSKRR